ncbi:hypothetical protein [Streptomyces montanus]|uniref:hypothetical protein n=1 Tax=Streptomyces montanus TaxID=2580423 RepID=UPI001FE8BB3E|nr:hypothetical protein [Streptomyces montanus]
MDPQTVDLPAVVAGFRNVTQIAGLDGAWRWSPVPGIEFAGALSADGTRLLQLSGRDSYDHELAVATLEFAREREKEIFARNPYLGALEGFRTPTGRHGFDAVVGIAPEVHDFYHVQHPELTPHVRLTFPAYACEFSGQETLDEAITRYRMLRLNNLDREPLPFLRMRYANTRTKGRSTNPGRGFTEPRRLVEEIEWMEGAGGSFVEFENRHGGVWRVEWHGTWLLAEWGARPGTPREIGLGELLEFASSRLRD